MPGLVREYADTGKVLLAFKHLPLAIHPLALELDREMEYFVEPEEVFTRDEIE